MNMGGPAYRLITFGGLTLLAPDGERCENVQRKGLALLALLMAGPNAPLSRDKAVAYLWPEVDEGHANSALYQLLYRLRRDVGEIVSLTGKELTIDRAAMTSDASDFAAAYASGDMRRTVELYGGSFLDGFNLRACAEFERWADEVRRETERQCIIALSRLAEGASLAGDHARSAELWERAVRFDPLRSAHVIQLMRELAAAGEPAAALRRARIHLALLRDELDVGGSAELMSLIQQLESSTIERRPDTPGAAGGAVMHAETRIVEPSAPPPASRKWALAAGIVLMIMTAAAVALPRLAVTATKGRWELIATAPAPIATAAAGVIGDLHIVGGEVTVGSFSAATISFNPITRRWTREAPLAETPETPAPRHWLSTNRAVIGARLFAIAGNIPGYCTANSQAFEPANNRWQQIAPLPIPLCHAAAVAVDGRVYVVGGTNTSGDVYNTRVFVYDPRDDSWTTLRTPMPVGLTSMAAAAVGTRIYLIGGAVESAICTRRLLVFDTARETWSYGDSMSVARCNAAAVTVAGRLYVIGGHDVGAGAGLCRTQACYDSLDVQFSSVESYDVSTNRWRREPSLPHAGFGMVAAEIAGQLYVAGGSDGHRVFRDVYLLTY